MAAPLPSLALEMSMDGIALHQLAFDGHWHELSRVGLNDAALREKMANMREIAKRLGGRKCQVRVWLPNDQIIRKSADISSDDPRGRLVQGKQALAKVTPKSTPDLAVAVAPENDAGDSMVAGARLKTMREAFEFAKSHGFQATAYSSRDQVKGFDEKPYFTLPPNRIKTVGLGIVGLILVGGAVTGGIVFKNADPYRWFETPPEVVFSAPFQNPDLGLVLTAENILPPATSSPVFNGYINLAALSARDALPYVPPRRLDATAIDEVIAPAPLIAQDFDVAFSEMPEIARFSLPQGFTNIAEPARADRVPSLGLYNILTDTDPLTSDTSVADAFDVTLPPNLTVGPTREAPITVASIQFLLEPLPDFTARISVADQRELSQTFGISFGEIISPEPIMLAESQVVDVTRGLPDLLPLLRSGAEIPPQVAVSQVQPTVTIIETIPADAETIATAARGFQIIQGQPDIVPARRFVLPEVVIDVASTDPELATPSEIEATPIEPENLAGIAPNPVVPANIIAEAALSDIPARDFNGVVPVLEQQPDLLPLLRSGNAIPEPGSQPVPELVVAVVEASVAEITPQPGPLGEQSEIAAATQPVEIDPSIAEANALRAKRRPQAIIDMEAPPDVMISDAAPVDAVLAMHRSSDFDAIAARIVEANANRPRAVAPVVPNDPQTVVLPTTASVARAATIENGINLSKTSLIGIFGTADNRDVLIRLASGRILDVGLGDRFSGWTVVAISDDSIRIQKGNRTEILRMPN